MTPWTRTCQACGHKQLDTKPDSIRELTSTYRNRKCRKCKSEALDYGTQTLTEEETQDEDLL